jgi:hypothetical protein
MTHSIISWDCCFRNFFHLIGSLAKQNYPKDEYEFIFVEQWTKKLSDDFNHRYELLSLDDTVKKYADEFNVRAVFLDKTDRPYHLGIANNAGIALAKGKFISVMDGDLLVKDDFLRKLENACLKNSTIYNLDRRYAQSPAGVSADQWMKAKINFDDVLNECMDKDREIPKKVANKGPMISAPAEWWKSVKGYDEHRVWSSGVSRLGQDVTARLELFSNKESIAMTDTFCVHPFHPMGFDRDAAAEKLILKAQQKVIDYTVNHHITLAGQRVSFTDKIYNQYKLFIEANISGSYAWSVKARAKAMDLFNRVLGKVKRAFSSSTQGAIE